jgi:hypothetical protein
MVIPNDLGRKYNVCDFCNLICNLISRPTCAMCQGEENCCLLIVEKRNDSLVAESLD